MGASYFNYSKEQKALQQCKKIKDQLVKRVQVKYKKYQRQIESIQKRDKHTIIHSTAAQLATMMDNKQFKSRQILLCFIERSATIGISHNYLIDQLFDQAIQRANQCDKQRQENPKKVCYRRGMIKSECFPAFFGVPVSIKQTVLMKGYQSYGGFCSKLQPIHNQQTAFFELILDLGVIPFIRTNVPQSCLTVQTNNNMFGYSKNFINPERSCGGSSGGEGGAVGARCSPIGIGADIGGSLRIPAQFNGLYTLKPSKRNQKNGNSFYGQYLAGGPVVGQPGALTRSTQDLIIFCDHMFSPQNYSKINPKRLDPYLSLIPFNSKIFEQKPKFKIALIDHLNSLQCSISHKRALQKVKVLLQKKGHQVQQTTIPKFQMFSYFFIRYAFSHKNLFIFDEIRKNQPLIKQFQILKMLANIPWFIRNLLIKILLKQKSRLAYFIQATRPISQQQYCFGIFQVQKVLSKKVYLFFKQNGYDAALMPGFAIPSPKLGAISNIQICAFFNTGWNVLQYPVGSVPVTKVRKQETTYTDKHNDFFTRAIKDNMKDSQGMPIGIQIISTPNQEQSVLYLMKQVEDGLQKQ